MTKEKAKEKEISYAFSNGKGSAELNKNWSGNSFSRNSANYSRDYENYSRTGSFRNGNRNNQSPSRDNNRSRGLIRSKSPEKRRDQTPRTPHRNPTLVCFECGAVGHKSADCKNKGKKENRDCYKCGEIGHIARNCPKNF